MAAPYFKLACKFYALPHDADLVDNATVDSGDYSYDRAQTLGHYFPNTTGSRHKWQFLGEPIGLVGFTASWRANDMGTWSMTITASAVDEEIGYLMEAIRPTQSRRPRSFAVWQVASPNDGLDTDLSDPFASGMITAGTDGNPIDLADRLPDSPAWSKRGMSGPILRVMWSEPRGGLIQIVIQGSDWAWALQHTTQIRDYVDGTTGKRPALPAPNADPPSQVEFKVLVSKLLEVNAKYSVRALASAMLGGPELEGAQQFQISLDETAAAAGIQSLDDERIITPIGLYGIIAAFTKPAIDKLRANGALVSLYSTPPGQYNLLQVFQRLVERCGLIFYMIGPVVVFDAPGDEAAPDLVWESGRDIIKPSMDDHIPEATQIWTKHADYRRDWHVSSAITGLTRGFGYIQTSNVSVALKPADYSQEQANVPGLTQAQVLAASDTLTLEDIRAQNTALALALADNVSGTCQPLWGDKTQFGIHFWLGMAVEVRITQMRGLWSVRDGATPTEDRRGLIVRQVQITFTATAWGCTTALGAKADVVPEMLPYEAALPKPLPAKTKQQPKTPKTTPSGDGWGPGGNPYPDDFVFGQQNRGGGMTSPITEEMEEEAKRKAATETEDPEKVIGGMEFPPGVPPPHVTDIPAPDEPPGINGKHPAYSPWFRSAPFNPGAEMPPGAGEPPTVPHDPSREVIPGTNEPIPEKPKPPAPYDPGSEFLG